MIDATFIQNNQQRVHEQNANVSIRYCVMNAIKRTGDHSMNEYFDNLQLAIDCVRELRLYHEASIEVLYAQPNDAGIVLFPPDMIDYVKVGIEVYGQLFNLTLNENMILNRAQKCGVDLREMHRGVGLIPQLTGGYFYAPHFRGSQYIEGLYGLGGGFNVAYYRPDYKMRRFEFDGFLKNNEVIIEYKSTGISAGSIISAQAIPVIREYILWQRIENDPRVPTTQKQRKQDQYDAEVEKLRTYTNNFTMQEFLDTMYSTYKQSPKR